ncbi:MAG: monovalent cation/H(+) antiporter subunit G [Anaerolineae bacterium]|nr:monovalent cation/H(+) antiporter subunit G [Anaerolineae bacterium]
MQTVLDVLALAFLIFGSFFSLVGVIGILRLPDAFSRLHASGKVGTLGLLGIIIAMMALEPAAIAKLVVLAGFMILAAPVTSHAIAVAVNRRISLRESRQHLEEAPEG